MSSLLRTSSPKSTSPVLLFAATLLSLSFTLPARAAIDESIPNPQTLAQLQLRASQASARDQCFLYAELVHTMTEKAGREIADGNTQQAAATLQMVNQYAHLIHVNLARDTKRLKNAEMLMHHTTFRLGQYLHLVPADDQASVRDTLKQLNQLNDELLAQVFNQ